MWFLILAVVLIVLFMRWATHKPLYTRPEAEFPGRITKNLPWGFQKYGVKPENIYTFPKRTSEQKIFMEMINRMGWEPIEEEIYHAILFGLEIALKSDDYARSGIEFEQPDFLQKQLEKIEFELFESDLYKEHHFYAHSILVLQDMLESSRNKSEKSSIQNAIDFYSNKIKSIEPKLKANFTGLNIKELGTFRDRQLFYFKIGITNYLRSKKIVPELDQLYFVYGVNYRVERAFQACVREFPLFTKLIHLELEQIAEWSLLDWQRFVKNELGTGGTQKYLDEKESI